MQTFSGVGAQTITTVFTVSMPGWYDFRSRLSAYAANGSSGLILHWLVNGIEVVSGGNPAIVYSPPTIPFGTTFGMLHTLAAYGGSGFRAAYAELPLDVGDVVSFSIGTASGAAQPSWTVDFTAERLGDDI